MLKKVADILNDRTTSSLLFSIAGLLLIMAFTMMKQRSSENQPNK
jgi:hypothetical protein